MYDLSINMLSASDRLIATRIVLSVSLSNSSLTAFMEVSELARYTLAACFSRGIGSNTLFKGVPMLGWPYPGQGTPCLVESNLWKFSGINHSFVDL